VRQRVGVVPYRAEVLNVANERRELRAAVDVNLQLVAAATNVGEETRVFEHRYGGLAVEKGMRL